MNVTEQMIREHAYQLWDRAGRPDFRTEEFWFVAKTELELKEETVNGRLGARVHRSANARSETAADWGKRGRDPSF